MGEGKFVTAINCMDGRAQLPVIEWMKKTCGADYVDMITEPGPDKILSEDGNPLAESIRSRARISVEKHGSEVIAVVSHGDCAGNPVSKDEHLRMLKKALETVSGWFTGVELIGVWIDSETWGVKRVY